MTKGDRAKAFRYINAYQKERYDRITLLVKKGEKPRYQELAKQNGMTTSEFFVTCAEYCREHGIF